MHAFKIDLMTVLVLVAIIGIVLTMGLGHQRGEESVGAVTDQSGQILKAGLAEKAAPAVQAKGKVPLI